jgi:mono/diheme cytochrome c family protein
VSDWKISNAKDSFNFQGLSPGWALLSQIWSIDEKPVSDRAQAYPPKVSGAPRRELPSFQPKNTGFTPFHTTGLAHKVNKRAFAFRKETEMKNLRLMMLCLAALGLAFSYAFGAGDAAKGKALFMDPQLAGGTTGKSCSSCHQDGEGAAKAADKNDVRQIINGCIQNALQGKPIPVDSAEMDDLVAYLKSVNK